MPILNVHHVLERLHIATDSRLRAVQDVRILIEKSVTPIATAKQIIDNLVISPYDTKDEIEARMVAQRLVDEAIILGEHYDPEKALEKAALKIAQARVETPWVFAKDGTSTVVSTTTNVEGVNIEVKEDGKIKKGGKQILAAALFEKHKALSNQEIIAIFMKELDMSKPGATTYLYNCKKAAK